MFEGIRSVTSGHAVTDTHACLILDEGDGHRVVYDVFFCDACPNGEQYTHRVEAHAPGRYTRTRKGLWGAVTHVEVARRCL